MDKELQTKGHVGYQGYHGMWLVIHAENVAGEFIDF